MSNPLAFKKPSVTLEVRNSFGKLPQVLEIPNLIQVQLDSFRWFQEEGLRELFQEISPIKDFTGNRLELHFIGYEFRQPAYSLEQCRERDVTYTASLYVMSRLVVKDTGEIKEQEIFFGDIPIMTENGTFVISGAERVVVNQLLRSPGIYFSLREDPTSGRKLCSAKLIPEHGAWLEFETSGRDVIFVKVNGKRKIPVAILLKAIGYDNDSQLFELFKDVDEQDEHAFIRSTLEKEPLVKTKTDALVDIYKRLRPGDPVNPDNAQTLLYNLFFNPRRYDLGKVGRFKLNKRLGLNLPATHRSLTPEDFIEIVRYIILINKDKEAPDDIDHLRNRRVRTAGHLIQNQFRIGLLRLERTVKERMSIVGPEVATPAALINNRPIVASMREFFGGSQLSQFMDQTNPLSELTHKRRLSAMGPGGLSRERAGFDVRDVHYSHYGKICPIETPEGPNIGLIGSLATYAAIDDYGFIKTPYRKVFHGLPNNSKDIVNRKTSEDIAGGHGKVTVAKGTVITADVAKKLASLSRRDVRVVPFVSGEIVYLTADEEEHYTIAQANALLNQRNEFVEDRIGVIRGGKYLREPAESVDFMDVSPKQVFSVTTSLIPFLEHDDANRALMGSNMQRQAVPLLCSEAPLVATGVEREVAKYSGQVLFARNDGEVISVTSNKIVIRETTGNEQAYPLMKFVRTNQGTCINQRPVVSKGKKVVRGQILADSSATDHGELALGQNVLCAFMSWRGYNFEDAIILSEKLVKNDKFTSIHIEKFEVEARDTKLGPEEITRDIPNVGEESLRDLDEHGIIRVGAEVSPGSVLVGKISPKGETELTAEEKLLRAIFGEKAREVKDSSLRVPHGEWGKVTKVKVSSRDDDVDLPAGVHHLVRVWVAQKRKISVGDKMAGRHGNKGVISCILPEEDMPILPDGRSVDIILNPIGVPSRMNIGQILETHLGWAAEILGTKILNPIFDGADNTDIEDALARAWIVQQSGAVNAATHDGIGTVEFSKARAWLWDRDYDANKVFDSRCSGEARRACLRLWLDSLGINVHDLGDDKLERTVEKVYAEQRKSPPIFGKIKLRDGRTGNFFDQPVTVGSIYMMKLAHLVEDKVHARSTGPYSLITQQPLGGKAQFGGQRFGEMEVWALEAYGASHMLQEMLTVKSDDVAGRAKAYESLVKGEDIIHPGVPESFKVLFMELRSLGLAVELLNEEEEMIGFLEERKKIRTKPRALK
jgi:DNA-directed RNA polymerase subunit beta